MRSSVPLTILCFIALLGLSSGLDRQDADIQAFSLDIFKAAHNLRGSLGALLIDMLDKIEIPKLLSDADSDVYRTAAEVVMNKGYRFSEHFVQTQDGYILTVWRVQKSVTRKHPVILQHGLLDCSFSWFVNLPDQSLSYILADAGYDVWVTNNRGNKFSRKHVNYTQKNDYRKFWNFTWDEMAKYDLPANVEFIKSVTGANKVHYIGHSQGTTQWFAHMSTDIEDQALFKSFTGLGPVMFLEHINSYFSFSLRTIKEIVALTGFQNILSLEGDHNEFLGEICDIMPKTCGMVIKMIVGFTQTENFNSSRISVIASQEPGGASLMTINHWIQMFGKPGFPLYDYGSRTNMYVYGQESAPYYHIENLKKLNIPLLLCRGTADPMVNEMDFNALVAALPSDNIEVITTPDWGHLDYIWSINANKQLYPSIVNFLAKADSDN
mmetsp:Transcript_59078/g.68349  ORF Transcript_59078/g.68349 Transcript_59078/m.68349 type:complete len:438 (-) Transcript_59078:132-1445(-)